MAFGKSPCQISSTRATPINIKNAASPSPIWLRRSRISSTPFGPIDHRGLFAASRRRFQLPWDLNSFAIPSVFGFEPTLTTTTPSFGRLGIVLIAVAILSLLSQSARAQPAGTWGEGSGAYQSLAEYSMCTPSSADGAIGIGSGRGTDFCHPASIKILPMTDAKSPASGSRLYSLSAATYTLVPANTRMASMKPKSSVIARSVKSNAVSAPALVRRSISPCKFIDASSVRRLSRRPYMCRKISEIARITQQTFAGRRTPEISRPIANASDTVSSHSKTRWTIATALGESQPNSRWKNFRFLFLALGSIVIVRLISLGAALYAAISRRSSASHAATRSDTSQSRSVTPAAIAGVVRRVR